MPSPAGRFFLALKGESFFRENMALVEEQVRTHHFGFCHMDALL